MAQVLKKFISNNAISGTKLRLDNNESLRARNAANSADVGLLKLKTDDTLEISISTVVVGNVLPDADSTRNIGSSSLRYASVNAAQVNANALAASVGSALDISTVSATGASFDTVIRSGASTVSGNSGNVSAYSGDVANGTSGFVDIRSGSATIGNTGYAQLITGDAVSGDSGAVIIATGSASGVRGDLSLNARQVSIDADDGIVFNSASGMIDISGLILTNVANGVGANDAINFTQLATKLSLSGGTMSGAIAMGTFKITGLGDPTANQDAATKKYVDDHNDATKLSLSGGTMTGNIAMGNNMVSGLGAPVNSGDAVRKAYVDSIASGALWYNPINDPDLVDDSLAVDPGFGSVVVGDVYIAAATNGGWTAGHAYFSDGSQWVDLLGRAVIAGDRFGVSMESATVGAGGLAGKDNQLAQIVSPTPGAITYTFEIPSLSKAVYVSEPNSTHTGHQYNYNGSAWVEFGGLNAVSAGIGLSYSGNVLSVNLGAGVAQLPTDEVGLDLHANGGLMTTVDNSTSSTSTASQLALKLADTSLSKSASGVKANLDEDTLTLDTTVKVKHSRLLTNDNGSAITAGQIAYIKSNGNVDLAIASTAGLDSIWLGVVKDASIASTAAGAIIVRPGAIVSGLSGLTPGKKQYLSRATAGAVTESLAGFLTGEHVYSVGYAISSTEMVYQPQFEYVF